MHEAARRRGSGRAFRFPGGACERAISLIAGMSPTVPVGSHTLHSLSILSRLTRAGVQCRLFERDLRPAFLLSIGGTPEPPDATASRDLVRIDSRSAKCGQGGLAVEFIERSTDLCREALCKVVPRDHFGPEVFAPGGAGKMRCRTASPLPAFRRPSRWVARASRAGWSSRFRG